MAGRLCLHCHDLKVPGHLMSPREAEAKSISTSKLSSDDLDQTELTDLLRLPVASSCLEEGPSRCIYLEQ